MNHYSEQLTISKDYFKHTLDEYDNWQFAWFRETAKNAIEAKATQIDYTVTEKDKQTIKLSAVDNGCGMDLETLRHDLLKLGGSSKKKSNNREINVQYGSAKNIILFSHQSYQIDTRTFLVTGQGHYYSIEPADDYLQGTSITVLVDISHRLFKLRQNCRILAQQFQTELSISLNGKQLKKGQDNFDHQLELPIGTFHFNELAAQDETEIFYWVKLNGLPLFSSYIYSSGQFNIDGTLNLTQESEQFLTSNHEGFQYEICQLLSTLFHELSHSGHKLKSSINNI